MFESFKKKENKEVNTEGLSEELTAQAQEMVKGSVLENDEHTKAMFTNGFIGPDGTQLDPIAFLEQRKEFLETDGAGASSSEIKEQVVHSDPNERQLNDAV